MMKKIDEKFSKYIITEPRRAWPEFLLFSKPAFGPKNPIAVKILRAKVMRKRTRFILDHLESKGTKCWIITKKGELTPYDYDPKRKQNFPSS